MELTQIREMLNAIQGSAHVSTAVGEPVTVGERVLIPVAEIAYGGGGGGGTTREPNDENIGGGGGGGVRVRPLGCWVVGPDGERWMPVIDVTRVAMVAGGIVIGVLWALHGLSRRR